jgi:omega-6 fatty acid desaturase (delta-12 desaturase)
MTEAGEACGNSRLDASAWARKLQHYGKPDATRSACELAITSLPLAAAWYLMLLALKNGQLWLYALLLLPASGFLVRLFIIQHDCGHGSFSSSRRVNDWIGRLIGVLTFTPYHTWRRGHSIHHASSGNLDRRGIGDVDVLTVAEYLARSRWGRLRYRLCRHPMVMLGVGPLYLFALRNRLPIGFMRAGWKPWFSTMSNNVAIATFVGLMIWAVGVEHFLLIQIPILVISGAAGIWLFYVQHQFRDTYWARGEDWSMRDGALHGSSHYDLPAVLKWFTANIGVHHVHHLSSAIPYYRLPEVLRDNPELRDFGRITLMQSVRVWRLMLWDEERRRLLPLSELRAADAIA